MFTILNETAKGIILVIGYDSVILGFSIKHDLNSSLSNFLSLFLEHFHDRILRPCSVPSWENVEATTDKKTEHPNEDITAVKKAPTRANKLSFSPWSNRLTAQLATTANVVNKMNPWGSTQVAWISFTILPSK